MTSMAGDMAIFAYPNPLRLSLERPLPGLPAKAGLWGDCGRRLRCTHDYIVTMYTLLTLHHYIYIIVK